MDRQKLLQRITLEIITEAMGNIEAVEQGYEHNQGKILEEIEDYFKSNLELDTALIADIQDCISMGEEKAFLLGICEGIRLMKSTERI